MVCAFWTGVSRCLSLCYRNPFELRGWHLVWGQVSMCDVRGYPQPPVHFSQYDHSLPGAWHHIHVSHSLFFPWTCKLNKLITEPVTGLQSKSRLIEASVLSDVSKLKVKQHCALLYSCKFDCWTVCAVGNCVPIPCYILIYHVVWSLWRSDKTRNTHKSFERAVNGHYWPTMQCTKEVEELLTAGKDYVNCECGETTQERA